MNFNAIDLVKPDPEPPVLRWVNPEPAELAIAGPRSASDRPYSQRVVRCEPFTDPRYGFDWHTDQIVSCESVGLGVGGTIAIRDLPRYPAGPRVGDTISVRQPPRFRVEALAKSALNALNGKLESLRQMQRDWPDVHNQIQQQIDALG